MNTFKFLTFFWVILITLASCEQEEASQNPLPSSLDLKPDPTARSSNPTRNFEVLDLTPLSPDRDGYQRLKQNKATGSILYAIVRDGKLAGYQMRKRDGRTATFVSTEHGSQCPDLYVCIHPQTGKYIFYDKCKTDNPCDRAVCSDLVWCIHPETGDYILYDKCKTDTDPCQQRTPPLISVSKKYKVNLFCLTVDYTWMIDPETGEYILLSECSNTQQLFLAVGW